MTQSTMSNICKDIIKLGLSRTIISGLTSAFQVSQGETHFIVTI